MFRSLESSIGKMIRLMRMMNNTFPKMIEIFFLRRERLNLKLRFRRERKMETIMMLQRVVLEAGDVRQKSKKSKMTMIEEDSLPSDME